MKLLVTTGLYPLDIGGPNDVLVRLLQKGTHISEPSEFFVIVWKLSR